MWRQEARKVQLKKKPNKMEWIYSYMDGKLTEKLQCEPAEGGSGFMDE